MITPLKQLPGQVTYGTFL